MKLFPSIECAALCAVLQCAASLAADDAGFPKSDAEIHVLENVQQETKLPAISYDYFATAPARDAWEAFRAATREMDPSYWRSDPVRVAAMRKACVFFARNREAAAFLEKKIFEIPPREGNYVARWEYYVEPLSRVPAVWAARIFGKLLFDERPMEATGRVPELPLTNPALGARALANMDLPGSPQMTRGAIDEGRLEEWGEWWKASGRSLESLIAEKQKEFSRERSEAEYEAELWSHWVGVFLQEGKQEAEIRNVEDLRTAPPKAAWRLWSLLMQDGTSTGKKLRERAGRTIALNSQVRALAEASLKPVTTGYQPEMPDLSLLGGIPAPWSVRILGAHLMSATPMDPATTQYDVIGFNNRTGAITALSAMGFSDAPTKLDESSSVQFLPAAPSVLAQWQAWWKANEGRIEERIHEINPEFAPGEP